MMSPYLTKPGVLACPSGKGVWVNDQHFQLNRTRVSSIQPIKSLADIRKILKLARKSRQSVAIAGGRHSAGGQQFLTDSILLDTVGFNDILGFDREKGLIEVEAGIQW